MRHCISCKHNQGTDYPPSPGDKADGVNCDSEVVANEQGAMEEFREYGNVNLWRIEIIGDGAECKHWESKP